MSLGKGVPGRASSFGKEHGAQEILRRDREGQGGAGKGRKGQGWGREGVSGCVNEDRGSEHQVTGAWTVPGGDGEGF